MKNGEAFELAEKLGVPFRKELLEWMRKDFGRYCAQCRFLTEGDEYFEETLEIFRSELPLSEMAGDPASGLCLGEEYSDYNRLQFIIQELDGRVLQGLDLLETGLMSSVTRNRYRAAEVLKSWVKIRQQPLSLISFRMYKVLREAKKKETNDKIARTFDLLILGRTEFPEEEQI